MRQFATVFRIAFLILATGGALFCEEITFEGAATLMFEKNPLLAQRKIERQIAEKQWGQSRASYLPAIDLIQGWNRSNNPVYVFGTLLNQQRFSEANFAVDSLNHPAPISDVSSKFQLGWLLYDFGRRESQVSSARISYDIAKLQEEGFRAALLEELVRRYYAVSLAQQGIETAEEALKSAQARLDQAKNRVQAGMVVQTDMLSAEVFVAGRRQEHVDAVNRKRLAIAALEELIGQELDREIGVKELAAKEFLERELSWWKEQMRANRPDWKVSEKMRKQAEAQTSLQRSAFLPSVQAWSAYEWHGTSLDYSGENWGAGLELRWNLFRGFADASGYSVAKLNSERAAEREREIQSSLWLQLQSAYFTFQGAREKWKVAAAALDQAVENKRIYGDRYGAGLVTIQDSLQAETAYSETRLMVSQNLYELRMAYAALLRAAGRPDDILSEIP